jgi:hypothetical protein
MKPTPRMGLASRGIRDGSPPEIVGTEASEGEGIGKTGMRRDEGFRCADTFIPP